MQAVHHSEAVLALSVPLPRPRRRRRVYTARWRLSLGAVMYGGVVIGRAATALGRQIYVVIFPCGTTRHLLPRTNESFTID